MILRIVSDIFIQKVGAALGGDSGNRVSYTSLHSAAGVTLTGDSKDRVS